MEIQTKIRDTNREMRKIIYISSFLLIVCIQSVLSQVTIGSNEQPNPGALLDLKESPTNSNKGLLLPRVSLQKLDALTMGNNVIANQGSQWKVHTGMLVYNINTIETASNRVCPGLHVWDGSRWFPVQPYDNILEQKKVLSLVRNYQYLESDPSNAQFDASLWPADKRADAIAGKYILGHTATNNTDDLVDVRGTESNTYFVSRFYVGYKTENTTYQVQRSYKCDSSATPNWVTVANETQMNKIFDDGIWTTQNMRTAKFPDGTDIPYSANGTASSISSPYYANPNRIANLPTYGRFYNWPAVINMGTGAGQTPDPGGMDQGGSENADVKIQGICPNGWHVPSIQELTDLYNAVSLNAPLFSAEASGSNNLIKYTFANVNDIPYVTGPMWNALRASTMGGNSDAADKGGFYSQPSGRPGVSVNTYYWTASSSFIPISGSQAFGSYITNTQGVMRERMPRYSYQSVRCVRNTK